jgi:hypothetical protein
MHAGLEEDFRSEIVAQAGNEGLVEKQRPELASAESRLGDTLSELFGSGRFSQKIGTESTQVRVTALVLLIQHLDFRGRVEQRVAFAAAHSKPEQPVGTRHPSDAADVPAAIELIVAVDAETAGEAGQHRFTAGRNLDDAPSRQDRLESFEFIEREKHLSSRLAGDGSRNPVGCTANFRTFWHSYSTSRKRNADPSYSTAVCLTLCPERICSNSTSLRGFRHPSGIGCASTASAHWDWAA